MSSSKSRLFGGWGVRLWLNQAVRTETVQNVYPPWKDRWGPCKQRWGPHTGVPGQEEPGDGGNVSSLLGHSLCSASVPWGCRGGAVEGGVGSRIPGCAAPIDHCSVCGAGSVRWPAGAEECTHYYADVDE